MACPENNSRKGAKDAKKKTFARFASFAVQFSLLLVP
jgi:hypothetical protein